MRTTSIELRDDADQFRLRVVFHDYGTDGRPNRLQVTVDHRTGEDWRRAEETKHHDFRRIEGHRWLWSDSPNHALSFGEMVAIVYALSSVDDLRRLQTLLWLLVEDV